MEDNKDTQVVDNGENVTPEKTYTEQDIQNSFNAGVKKASSEWQKDEKYKEFLSWKKSNQNDGEKIAELQANNNDLQSANNNLKNENAILKAQMKINDSDVKKEFSEFVTSEVMKRVNDTTDFDTALKDYKKEKPQYFSDVIVKKVQTSPTLAGGVKPQTTNDIMNNFIRGN